MSKDSSIKEALLRLAAYEDTGLTPEEINETISRFERFLVEMTGGRMSKFNYTLDAMIAVANDYQQSACDECEDRQELAALKERTHAEKDGKLYTVHDVAVILASAIGDDCACNINSNDEWLPQLCELQEACPEPVGVACWEQYLKHRAEAEKVLDKEAQS